MDIPPPLLERLKRHGAPPSLDAYPHKQKGKNPYGTHEDTTNNSDNNKLNPAPAPSGARKLRCGAESVAGGTDDNCRSSSGSTADSSAGSSKTHCRKPVTSSDNSRSLVRDNSSNVSIVSSSASNVSNTVGGAECNDTSGTTNGSFRSTVRSNTCDIYRGSVSAVNRNDATGVNVTDCVQGDGGSSSVDGSHSSRRKDSRNTSGGTTKAAVLSDSADRRVQAADENTEKNTTAAAPGKATLSARCAWSSTLHRFGDNEWMCHGLYADEGFHCVYLLRSLQTPRCTYIGYSVNPLHRLRQHNGDVSHGGAWKTRRHRPWTLVLVVYGFPHAVAALQFEWRWQRTVPAASSAQSPARGRRSEHVAAAHTAASIGAAMTRAAACGGTYCFEMGSSSMQAPAESKHQRVTAGVTCGRRSSRGSSERLHETKGRNEIAAVQRMLVQTSAASVFHKRAGLDPGIQTAPDSANSGAVSGSTSMLEFSSTVRNSARGAGVSGTDLNRQQGADMESMRASFVSADSCNQSTSPNSRVEFPCKCSSSPVSTSAARHKAFCATLGLTANVASGVDSSNPRHRHEPYTQQRIPYRLSRTGNGIVARVGLRLQTLLALLHTDPFRHMPLGVHVVDAYTAAPYFRRLLRERKTTDLQQQQPRGDVTPRCASPHKRNRAHTRRHPTWIPLQRSLVVSFGEAALLLPLIRHLPTRRSSARRNEDKSHISDMYDRANLSSIKNSGASCEYEDYSRRSSSSNTFRSTHGMSWCTVDVVEDEAVAFHRAETTTGTTTASLNKSLPVPAYSTTLGCSARPVDDCVHFFNRMPWCRLCGHVFLQEPRERPASRCGRCMCFYHLTCLARSALDKKRRASSRGKQETAPGKRRTGTRASEALTSEGESRCGEDTGGIGPGEGYSPYRSSAGLVPLEVKCFCCGLVRSWAEVIADGVVFAADTVQV